MTEVTCHFCTRGVEERYAYQKVVGWERERAAGGANQITLREPQGVFACDGCIRKLKAGISTDQATLI